MSDDLENPPGYVFEFMPVDEEEWVEMSPEERQEVAKETLEAMTEALQPLVKFVKDDLMPSLNSAAHEMHDAFTKAAEEIGEEINQEIDMQDVQMGRQDIDIGLSENQRDNLRKFAEEAKEAKRRRK